MPKEADSACRVGRIDILGGAGMVSTVSRIGHTGSVGGEGRMCCSSDKDGMIHRDSSCSTDGAGVARFIGNLGSVGITGSAVGMSCIGSMCSLGSVVSAGGLGSSGSVGSVVSVSSVGRMRCLVLLVAWMMWVE